MVGIVQEKEEAAPIGAASFAVSHAEGLWMFLGILEEFRGL